MTIKPAKLLCLENIVGATLLSFFTWVVLSLFEIEQAVAVIQSEQVIDKQVNKEVREMRDIIIRIDSNVHYIREDIVRSQNKTK